MYETICQPPPDEGDKNDDEIESSEEPHLLWGLQGSPYVFCSSSGTSGLDAPASNDYEDHVPGYNGKSPIVHFCRRKVFYIIRVFYPSCRECCFPRAVS